MRRRQNEVLYRAFVVSNSGNPGSQPMLNLTEQSWVWTGTAWGGLRKHSPLVAATLG